MSVTALQSQMCDEIAAKTFENIVTTLQSTSIEWERPRVEELRCVLLPVLRKILNDMVCWNSTYHECNDERMKLHYQYDHLCKQVQQTEEGDELLSDRLAQLEQELKELKANQSLNKLPPHAGF